MPRKKILAASYHIGGINSIIPVIRRLRAEDKLDCEVIGHGTDRAISILNREDIAHKQTYDFGCNDTTVDSMRTLVDRIKPNLVLTGTAIQTPNDVDILEQTLTVAARDTGIPTIAVFDTWINYKERFSDIIKGRDFVFMPDTLAVMDNFALDEMIALGFDKHKLVITGNPHFDDKHEKAQKFSSKDKIEALKIANICGNPLLHYVGGAWKKWKNEYGYWDLDIIRILSKAVTTPYNAKSSVAITLHPNQPAEEVNELKKYLMEQQNGGIRIIENLDSETMMMCSDFVVSAMSTLSYVAVYMEKPFASLQPGTKVACSLKPLTQRGFIAAGYSNQSCFEIITNALSSDKQYRTERLRQADGFRKSLNGTENVTQLVYNTLGI